MRKVLRSFIAAICVGLDLGGGLGAIAALLGGLYGYWCTCREAGTESKAGGGRAPQTSVPMGVSKLSVLHIRRNKDKHGASATVHGVPREMKARN